VGAKKLTPKARLGSASAYAKYEFDAWYNAYLRNNPVLPEETIVVDSSGLIVERIV
jgi:hypothetical protein